jgi:nicotinate-nucleotide--dimethylbenzimidazole phosphoribosyltransferase
MQDEFIRSTILNIRAGNLECQNEAQRHLDCLTKPIGNLGKLEEVAAQYVAWREEKTPVIFGKAIYVFAADHGLPMKASVPIPGTLRRRWFTTFSTEAQPLTCSHDKLKATSLS